MITSYEEYINLLDNEDYTVSRRSVLEAVPAEILFRAIRERPDLKVDIILNKLIPTSVLASLVDDPDPDVRYRVASKRKLPMVYLEKLAHDTSDGVRREVVHHTKITEHILEILRQDEESDIAEKAKRRLEEQDYTVNT